jgi:flagellar basal body-associated protein FliL
MYTIPSKSLSIIILLISASLLSLVAIATISIYHEASATECNNSDNGHDDSGTSSCSDKQDSDTNSNDGHEHSDGSNVKKDKTPFVLAEPVPFP